VGIIQNIVKGDIHPNQKTTEGGSIGQKTHIVRVMMLLMESDE